MFGQTWIENIFLKVLNMSLTASLVILVIMFVRLLLKKVPKIFSYFLWIVVLFRLLCPVSFSSFFSIFGTVPEVAVEQGQIEYIPLDIAYMEKPQVALPIPGVGNTVSAAINEVLPQKSETAMVDSLEMVVIAGTWIWLAGMGLLLIYSVVTLVNLHQKLKSAVQEEGQIFITDRIYTPFVYGLFRPRIYLPYQLKEQEKEYIILHEQIHIRRGDHIVKILALVALCIHWFNPLVWVAFFLSGKDMEMSCDEAVIRKIGDGVKKEYSTSLLVLSSGKRIVNGIPLAFGEGETGGRIKNILRYKKPTVIVSVTAVVVCAVIAVVLLANPKTAVSDEKQENSTDAITERITSVYGVVMDISLDEEAGSKNRIVRVPGYGDLEVPVAEKIIAYFDADNYELMPGDIVKITFAEDAIYAEDGTYIGVEVLDTYPGRFATDVDSIVCMGRQAYLEYTGAGQYRQVIPQSFILGAVAGDTVEIYHRAVGEDGKEEILLVSGVLKEVEGIGLGVLSIDMTLEQVQTYLSEFGFGITHKVITKENGEAVDEGWKEPDYEAKQLGEEDGKHTISIRALSIEDRSITTYISGSDGYLDSFSAVKGEALQISEDCDFWVNYGLAKSNYEKVTFEEFADFFKNEELRINKICAVTFENSQIAEMRLVSAYADYGIISQIAKSEDIWYEEIKELEGEDVLNEFYTLTYSSNADVNPYVAGEETIEVYAGNIGDGDNGLVLVKDEGGEVCYSESAHTARAGWNNVYLGEVGAIPYLFCLNVEDRDDYGGYSYYAFRLDEEWQPEYIVSSSFSYGEPYLFEEELFDEWLSGMEAYLNGCTLLLSSQDGEIRTGDLQEKYVPNLEKAPKMDIDRYVSLSPAPSKDIIDGYGYEEGYSILAFDIEPETVKEYEDYYQVNAVYGKGIEVPGDLELGEQISVVFNELTGEIRTLERKEDGLYLIGEEMGEPYTSGYYYYYPGTDGEPIVLYQDSADRVDKPVYDGKLYIRKDATIEIAFTYDMEMVTKEALNRGPWFNGVYFDENGYVTRLVFIGD